MYPDCYVITLAQAQGITELDPHFAQAHTIPVYSSMVGLYSLA